MNLSETLRKACKDMKMPLSELARRTNQSPQNLTMKLRRGSLGFQEFLEYLEILGISVNFNLVYPDGSSPDTPVLDRRAEEKMTLIQGNLDLAQKTIEFQRNLSMDIRTELFNVLGYADQALKQKENSNKTRNCLEKIKSSGIVMNRLLDDFVVTSQEDESEQITEPRGAGDLQGKRILVAEDNELNREILRESLEENGLNVETANDGQIALRMVRNAAPGYYDCILMDIRMPNMDGLEATRKIRALPNRIRAGIPIVAMTSEAYPEDREKSQEAGIDVHLVKPLDTGKLLSILAQYV